MRQLTLDLATAPAPRFDNFIAGANLEACAQLAVLSVPLARGALYLWGQAGSGRSHLLAAAVHAAQSCGRPAHYCAARDLAPDYALPQDCLLAVDDIDQAGPQAQIALFRAYNDAPERAAALVFSGPAPPLQLVLREDLRTRVGQALVYELQPLSDADKFTALLEYAQQRAIPVTPEHMQYLLTHGRRDIPWLIRVLDRLDAASLEKKRPVTIALLREIMQAREPD
ncbi:MAG: DnaA regulatory inactivator Hda [Rhodocyclaceae bacterium]|nr:DnaA regulatory inactivator Hda [Rhodocyclaceae bacterium]MBX3668447.1 DnaA regulatory inactivator Hda [Rhodocyclaceae bacterium]